MSEQREVYISKPTRLHYCVTCDLPDVLIYLCCGRWRCHACHILHIPTHD